jgi:hypothetical protein
MADSNVTTASVKLRYPALLTDWDDAALVALVQLHIDEANVDVTETYGTMRDRAVTALVAHRTILSMNENGGEFAAQYVVSSASAGGVSMTMSVPAPIPGLPSEFSHYYTTQPGVDYLSLARRVIGMGVRLVS